VTSGSCVLRPRLGCVRAQQDAALSRRQRCCMNENAEMALVLHLSLHGYSQQQKFDSEVFCLLSLAWQENWERFSRVVLFWAVRRLTLGHNWCAMGRGELGSGSLFARMDPSQEQTG